MSPVRINYWAEGPTDRAAARKLIVSVEGEPGDDYSGRRRAAPGKDHIDQNIVRFNAAAKFGAWFVLRDSDGECASELVARILPNASPLMRFRIVVPSIEAWLLADHDGISDFLSIDPRRLPLLPDDLPDAKAHLLALAGKSRSREIRESMLPVARSGRKEGPGYASILIEFINAKWQPRRAASRSNSLGRAIDRLKEVV